MKCPLLSAGEYTRNVSAPTLSCDCLREECAWWDSVNGHCALIELNRILWDISVILGSSVVKMPKEFQFRK